MSLANKMRGRGQGLWFMHDSKMEWESAVAGGGCPDDGEACCSVTKGTGADVGGGLIRGYDFALAAVAPERDDAVSLALWAATLAWSTTLRFHSRAGFWSMNADHLVKVVSGHLVMSRSRIILQSVLQGQWHPTR